MNLIVRPARLDDAAAMCALLNPLIEAGGTTAHRSPFDVASMQERYIAPPRLISCRLACDAKAVLGFQALEWADPDWPGHDPLPSDWAVIASFVARAGQGKGVGRLMFESTLRAAQNAGVTAIDATIRRENSGGLAYYSAMGFEDHRADEERISKKLVVV